MSEEGLHTDSAHAAHLLLPAAMGSRCTYRSHRTDAETEAQAAGQGQGDKEMSRHCPSFSSWHVPQDHQLLPGHRSALITAGEGSEGGHTPSRHGAWTATHGLCLHSPEEAGSWSAS